MRLKANKMGYSLNQRGLFAGVVRSTGDRSVKTNTGESRPCSRTSVLQPPCGAFPPLNLNRREREGWLLREEVLGSCDQWGHDCGCA